MGPSPPDRNRVAIESAPTPGARRIRESRQSRSEIPAAGTLEFLLGGASAQFVILSAMLLRWFLASKFRKAVELRRNVEKLVNEQRDLLGPAAIDSIASAVKDLQVASEAAQSSDALEKQMVELVAVAEKSLIAFPHPGIRENIKEFFVAATVILAITTFFAQLTKIPTGSMQPTLYGITCHDLMEQADEEIPNPLARFWAYWIHGISYYHVVAKQDGALRVGPVHFVLRLLKRQTLWVGEVPHSIWFPPEKLEEWTRPQEGRVFHRGEDILRLKVLAGDHLLVDRITYNFQRPQRGEIIVFKTRGITDLWDQDHLYIKRLVALGRELVRIGDDQHLVIDGKRLDASTPHFENVYTFSSSPRSNGYFGHVNQAVARRFTEAVLAKNFLSATNAFFVSPKHYLAMGDNTLNSHDSRAWGALPEENVIGKCWFVYWPFTQRFGWGNR